MFKMFSFIFYYVLCNKKINKNVFYNFFLRTLKFESCNGGGKSIKVFNQLSYQN